MKVLRIGVSIFILVASMPLWAKEDTKTTVVIVGGDKLSKTFANDLARDQMSLAQKRAALRAVEDEIAAGHYDVGIKKLEGYLAEGRMWNFFTSEILEDLVNANSKAGRWEDAVRYQQRILTTAVKGNWVMEYISDYWRLLEEYRLKVPNAVIEEKIPIHQIDLDGFIEKSKRFYADGIENNKLYLADLANFYLVRLDFDKATEYLKKGLETKRKGRLGKTYDKEILAMLRNVYILQGMYVEAVKINDQLIEDVHFGYEDELAIFLDVLVENNPSPKKLEFEFEQRHFKGSVRN